MLSRPVYRARENERDERERADYEDKEDDKCFHEGIGIGFRPYDNNAP